LPIIESIGRPPPEFHALDFPTRRRTTPHRKPPPFDCRFACHLSIARITKNSHALDRGGAVPHVTGGGAIPPGPALRVSQRRT
jgi:hypothetical protein